MSNYIQERYRPTLLGVNAVFTSPSNGIGGFLAKTAGTISISTAGGKLLVDTIPVNAGVYTPIPMIVATDGSVVTLAGGASGTLFSS